jgi:hypothetical protein
MVILNRNPEDDYAFTPIAAPPLQLSRCERCRAIVLRDPDEQRHHRRWHILACNDAAGGYTTEYLAETHAEGRMAT